eukprot:Sdes_comp24493_c0_seq1m22392
MNILMANSNFKSLCQQIIQSVLEEKFDDSLCLLITDTLNQRPESTVGFLERLLVETKASRNRSGLQQPPSELNSTQGFDGSRNETTNLPDISLLALGRQSGVVTSSLSTGGLDSVPASSTVSSCKDSDSSQPCSSPSCVHLKVDSRLYFSDGQMEILSQYLFRFLDVSASDHDLCKAFHPWYDFILSFVNTSNLKLSKSLENILSTLLPKDSSLINILMSHYFNSNSTGLVALLSSIGEQQSVTFFSKLNDYMIKPNTRYASLHLLLQIVKNQRPFLHKIVQYN